MLKFSQKISVGAYKAGAYKRSLRVLFYSNKIKNLHQLSEEYLNKWSLNHKEITTYI